MLSFSRSRMSGTFVGILVPVFLGALFLIAFPYLVHAQGEEFRATAAERRALEERDRAALATSRCCRCVHNDQNFCTTLTGVTACDGYRSGNEFSIMSQVQRNALVDFACTDLPLSACQSGATVTPTTGAPAAVPSPAPASATPPAQTCSRTFANFAEAVGTLHPDLVSAPSGVSTSSQFQSITPQLGVQIPGLVFSPARKEGGFVYIPFLAQYIAALERYAVALASIAAVIMIVYGGMLYLLGSAVQDTSTGKQIILDAITGLVLTLCAYLILSTVNPNTLDLQEIRLGFINPTYWGENLGAYSSSQSGSSPCRCAPIPPEVNEARVLGVPCFYQAGGSWGSLGYSTALLPPGESPPARADLTSHINTPTCTGAQASSGPNMCWGTFQQGACGPTALATVLGYYSARTKEGAPVTPLEAGRYAVRAGLRPFNGGTTGICSSMFTTEFPGFTCASSLRNQLHSPQGILELAEEIRSGHPIIFHCHDCRVRNAAGQEIRGAGDGHFMVLTGVSEDNSIFSVHDVGWGPPRGAIAVRAEDILNQTHTFTAPNGDGVMTQYTGNINIQAIIKPIDQSRIPQNGTCVGRARRSALPTSDDVIRIPFTYCPGGVCDGAHYQENQASLILDSSFLKLPNVSVRAFMYIHGLNTEHRTAENANYVNTWKAILSRYQRVGGPAVVVMTPHSMGSDAGSYFSGFNGPEFYRVAQTALQTAFAQQRGSFTIRDVSVGAHSSAICDGHFARAANASYPVGTRGLVAFDGCVDRYSSCPGGSCVMPTNTAFIMNPDQSTSERVHSLGRGRTAGLVSTYGLTPSTCPAYAQGGGVLRCYSKAQSTSNNGWTLFETNIGHSASVNIVGEFALRAFYGQ